MPDGRGQRNNIMAGVFVLVCLILGVVCVYVLSGAGRWLTPKSNYIVRFTINDGAEGLDPGSKVKLGGQVVGEVTKSTFVLDPATGEAKFIDVTIAVNSKIKIFDDADVQLIKPLFGSGSTINISGPPSAGEVAKKPTATPKPLAPGETISGRLGAPAFVTPTDYTRLQNIIERVDRITATAEPRIDTIMDSAQQAADDVKATSKNIRGISDDVATKWPNWSDRVDHIVTRVDTATKPIEEIADNARKLAANISAMVDKNRPAIEEAIDNVRQFVRKANQEGYDKFMALVTEARDGMSYARSVAKQTDALLAKKTPEIEDIISNSALAAEQLKLTTMEVRAAPWRLLYQPTKKELENELLYNSVRQYSTAVGQLREAAEALKSINDRVKEGGAAAASVDQKTIDQLTNKLNQAFDRYKQEEQAFLQRWVEAK